MTPILKATYTKILHEFFVYLHDLCFMICLAVYKLLYNKYEQDHEQDDHCTSQQTKRGIKIATKKNIYITLYEILVKFKNISLALSKNLCWLYNDERIFRIFRIFLQQVKLQSAFGYLPSFVAWCFWDALNDSICCKELRMLRKSSPIQNISDSFKNYDIEAFHCS